MAEEIEEMFSSGRRAITLFLQKVGEKPEKLFKSFKSDFSPYTINIIIIFKNGLRFKE